MTVEWLVRVPDKITLWMKDDIINDQLYQEVYDALKVYVCRQVLRLRRIGINPELCCVQVQSSE